MEKSFGKRTKNTSVVVPLVIGSMAFSLGKKAEEGRTHRWLCYVRGHHNEDLSYLIRRVVFMLHPSFTNPRRGNGDFENED